MHDRPKLLYRALLGANQILMKRKLTFAIALLFIVGAALWGVNYRLDNPPLTKADKEFRALVAGADNVEIKTSVCQLPNCTRFARDEYRTLNADQTRELIESVRLIDRTPEQFSQNQLVSVSILTFKHQQKELLPEFGLNRMASWNEFHSGSGPYAVHPRFNKRLNRVLDAHLPQLIRP